MAISYDVFTAAFLGKISEFDLLALAEPMRTEVVDGYLHRALTAFRKNCRVDLFSTRDDEARCFDVEVSPADLDELADILSEGMVVQWLKPFVYQQELLQNVLNTRDYSQYSPAELLMRVGNAYAKAQRDYTQMIREYSYNHGNLSNLHL